MSPTAVSVTVAALAGAGVEIVIHAVTGRREAWDTPLYWTTGLPVICIVAFAIGLLSRGASWLGTLAIVPAQVMTMMIRGGEVGNLWPLTMVVTSVLSAPFVAVAFAGMQVRRYFSGAPAAR